MMHGTKKSHSLIVPAKPANKAEQSAAESVEGDDGTKRNAERQSTVRTQGREAVSQAQDRIREAVNRNKKEKLTALLHHVSVDVGDGDGVRSPGLSPLSRDMAAFDPVIDDMHADTIPLADFIHGERSGWA